MAEHDIEVLAIRYGTVQTTRSETFREYGQYGEADEPLQMDFFFWLIRGSFGAVLVDTGFAADVGRRRGRTCLVDPVLALAGLGIQPGDVEHIIVSHFHYDHIGNLTSFPSATLTVAKSELEFWTGPGPRETGCQILTEPGEITTLLAAAHAGRVRQISDDTDDVVPGVDVRQVGGHTPGQLVITVRTGGARVILASDAVHFYEEMRRERPHRQVLDVPAMRSAYSWLKAQSDNGAIVVAGHDPEVNGQFEVVAALEAGSALRIAP